MQNCMLSHGQVSIVTTLRAGRSWVRILAGPRYFYVFFNVQTGCESHWPSYGMVSWFFPVGDVAGAWIWCLHRAPMLRIRGAIPLLPLYAFMSRLGWIIREIEPWKSEFWILNLIYFWKYWHVTTDLEREIWNLNWLICRTVSWLAAFILCFQCQKHPVCVQIPPGELV